VHLRVEDVSPRAVEEARRGLTEAADSQSRRRAELSVPDLLRECAALDGDGFLTRAGALLFCTAPAPASAPAAALAADPSVHYPSST
jgi:ATP-dependent DNA helicase RecG